MPTYEYDCAQCGSFTAMRPMRERNDPQSCPDCGKPASREMLTAPALAGAPSSKAAGSSGSSQHGMSCACCPGSGGSRGFLTGNRG